MFTGGAVLADEQAHDRSDRVEANARLTAMTGVVLLALFAAEVVTVVLGAKQVLSTHAAIGFLLIPLVFLKIASTSWRIVRYYRRDADYRRYGPPSPFLRVLGPVLMALTVVLLISGVVTYVGPSWAHPTALLTHQTSFYLWLAALASHVIAHFLETFRLTARDFFPRRSRIVSGLWGRRVGILAGLAAGVALALIFSGHASGYLAQYHHHR
ncbi:hypothetical protein ACFVWG_33855 [Kribbella sp. NPDC058245]|uniref:hypothetical protein n=1 Tax=Kribbella sp. NPDC058245 TaxID=3346399 RepID=UPI0036EE4315